MSPYHKRVGQGGRVIKIRKTAHDPVRVVSRKRGHYTEGLEGVVAKGSSASTSVLVKFKAAELAAAVADYYGYDDAKAEAMVTLMRQQSGEFFPFAKSELEFLG